MRLFFLALLSLVCLSVSAQQRLRIIPLSSDIYVFTTWQDFQGTLFPANGMYVVGTRGVFLVDAPWDTLQTIPLIDSIYRRHHARVLGALATHFHGDRTGSFGVLNRLGIPTYASRQTLRLSEERGEHRARYAFRADTVFRLGGPVLETRYFGAGHTADNRVVYDSASGVLFGGCMVKSSEADNLGNLADADPKAWVFTMQKLRKAYPKPRFVIPGHEGWADGQGIEHTQALLAEYLKPKKMGKVKP